MFGLRLIDRKQPYGIASAAGNCQRFGNLIIWIFKNKILISVANTKYAICVHVDDFMIAAKTEIDCKLITDLFDKLAAELGVRISVHKNVNWVNKTVIHGFEFDLLKKTVAIPEDKFKSLKLAIILILIYRKVTVRCFDCIVGRIMHWAQLCPQIKPITYQSVRFVYEKFRNSHVKKTAIVDVPEFILIDFLYWFKYADFIKSNSMKFILNQPSSYIASYTDACDIGGGWICGRDFDYFRFSDSQIKDWHINQKETYTVLHMLYTLRSSLTGSKVMIYIDNTTAMYALRKKWSKSKCIMRFVYRLCLLMIKYKIFVWVRWIPTDDNIAADALSRFDITTFWKYIDAFDVKVNKHKCCGPPVPDFAFEKPNIAKFCNEYIKKFGFPQ